MKIILVNGSSIPLYEQIVNAIKENIIDNNLSHDEQLPSVRQLSRELKVSILTVKKAYDELEKQGFIISRQGLGTFVSSVNPEIVLEEKQKEIEENLIRACEISKIINLTETELIELVKYLYKGDNDNE